MSKTVNSQAITNYNVLNENVFNSSTSKCMDSKIGQESSIKSPMNSNTFSDFRFISNENSSTFADKFDKYFPKNLLSKKAQLMNALGCDIINEENEGEETDESKVMNKSQSREIKVKVGRKKDKKDGSGGDTGGSGGNKGGLCTINSRDIGSSDKDKYPNLYYNDIESMPGNFKDIAFFKQNDNKTHKNHKKYRRNFTENFDLNKGKHQSRHKNKLSSSKGGQSILNPNDSETKSMASHFPLHSLHPLHHHFPHQGSAITLDSAFASTVKPQNSPRRNKTPFSRIGQIESACELGFGTPKRNGNGERSGVKSKKRKYFGMSVKMEQSNKTIQRLRIERERGKRRENRSDMEGWEGRSEDRSDYRSCNRSRDRSQDKSQDKSHNKSNKRSQGRHKHKHSKHHSKNDSKNEDHILYMNKQCTLNAEKKVIDSSRRSLKKIYTYNNEGLISRKRLSKINMNIELSKKKRKLVKQVLGKDMVYKGEMLNHQRHGYGLIFFQNDYIFQGNFHKNRPRGYGKIRHSAGDVFEGVWSGYRANGWGLLLCSFGALFIGEWTNDRQEGFGIELWPFGSVYVGEYRGNEKDGWGMIRFKDNTTYVGQFHRSKLQGIGTLLYKDNKYEGEFSENKFNGFGTIIWPNGDKFEGFFDHGKKTDFGILHQNSKVYFGFWVNGKINGRVIVYDFEKEKKVKKLYSDGDFINDIKEKGGDVAFERGVDKIIEDMKKRHREKNMRKMKEINVV